jgi:hypothetical protein
MGEVQGPDKHNYGYRLHCSLYCYFILKFMTSMELIITITCRSMFHIHQTFKESTDRYRGPTVPAEIEIWHGHKQHTYNFCKNKCMLKQGCREQNV